MKRPVHGYPCWIRGAVYRETTPTAFGMNRGLPVQATCWFSQSLSALWCSGQTRSGCRWYTATTTVLMQVLNQRFFTLMEQSIKQSAFLALDLIRYSLQPIVSVVRSGSGVALGDNVDHYLALSPNLIRSSCYIRVSCPATVTGWQCHRPGYRQPSAEHRLVNSRVR